MELDFGPYSYDKHSARMEIKSKLNKIEFYFGYDAQQMGIINTSMIDLLLLLPESVESQRGEFLDFFEKIHF